jgi:hypothetical protein
MRTQEEYCVFIIKKNKKKGGGRRNSSYIQCVGIIIFEIWNNEWNVLWLIAQKLTSTE